MVCCSTFCELIAGRRAELMAARFKRSGLVAIRGSEAAKGEATAVVSLGDAACCDPVALRLPLGVRWCSGELGGPKQKRMLLIDYTTDASRPSRCAALTADGRDAEK